MMDTLLRIEDLIHTLDAEVKITRRFRDMIGSYEHDYGCESFYNGRVAGLEFAIVDLKILRDTLMKMNSQEARE